MVKYRGILSLSRSPQPTCVFLPSLPSHHDLNFSLCLWPHITLLLPCPATTSNAMPSLTGTTRFPAMNSSTWASRRAFTLRYKHPFPRAPLSFNNRQTTSRALNLIKWVWHRHSLLTYSCTTMEGCYRPSSRSTGFLNYRPSLRVPRLSAKALGHRPRFRAHCQRPPRPSLYPLHKRSTRRRSQRESALHASQRRPPRASC
jgi:hypothetical protein